MILRRYCGQYLKKNREKRERHCEVSIPHISVKFVKLRAVFSSTLRALTRFPRVQGLNYLSLLLAQPRAFGIVAFLHPERHIRDRRERYRRKNTQGKTQYICLSLPNFRTNQGSPGCTGWRMNISSAPDKLHELPLLFRRERHREKDRKRKRKREQRWTYLASDRATRRPGRYRRPDRCHCDIDR